jgi:hypothetical protein
MRLVRGGLRSSIGLAFLEPKMTAAETRLDLGRKRKRAPFLSSYANENLRLTLLRSRKGVLASACKPWCSVGKP